MEERSKDEAPLPRNLDSRSPWVSREDRWDLLEQLNEGFDDRSLISRSGMIQQDMSELHRPSSSGRKDRSWTELAGE